MSGRRLGWGVACGLVLAGGGLLAQADKPPPARAADPAQRLAAALAEVDARLARVRAEADRLHRERVQETDPSALRAALVRVDEQILALQYPPPAPPEPVSVARRRAARPDPDNLTEAELNEWIDTLPEVAKLATAVRLLRERPPVGGDPDAAEAREAQLQKAQARLEEARKPLRDKGIAAARAYLQAQDAAEKKRADADRADRDRRVAAVLPGRQTLADRVVVADRAAAALRRLADDERVLSDVRAALMRQQLAAELGVSLPPGPTAGVDPADRLNQLDRKLAELKAALTAADVGGRLDALDRKLEEQLRSLATGRRGPFRSP